MARDGGRGLKQLIETSETYSMVSDTVVVVVVGVVVTWRNLGQLVKAYEQCMHSVTLIHRSSLSPLSFFMNTHANYYFLFVFSFGGLVNIKLKPPTLPRSNFMSCGYLTRNSSCNNNRAGCCCNWRLGTLPRPD